MASVLSVPIVPSDLWALAPSVSLSLCVLTWLLWLSFLGPTGFLPLLLPFLLVSLLDSSPVQPGKSSFATVSDSPLHRDICLGRHWPSLTCALELLLGSLLDPVAEQLHPSSQVSTLAHPLTAAPGSLLAESLLTVVLRSWLAGTPTTRSSLGHAHISALCPCSSSSFPVLIFLPSGLLCFYHL